MDPIGGLAAAAGHDDPERWWDDVVEHRGHGEPSFDAIAEAMVVMRDDGPSPGPFEAAREAAMRQAIRRAEQDGAERIAVVCGAWHVPAIAEPDRVTADADAATLRAMPAVKVAVTSRCVRGIDERGLHKTNLAALSDTLRRVAVPGALCLSDGFPVPPTGFDQRPVVGGDATSAAIAAASVIAKVTRDRFMQRMEERYPGWEFAAHVGYSTPEHRAAIEKLGVSPLHRMSFQSMAYQQLAL